MSQVEDNGKKNGPGEGRPSQSSPAGDKPKETVHRTLQETADMHGMSKSHLSRCVRQKKAAKGYYLRPYAQLKKKSDGTERILGFEFPVGYEPEDGKRNDLPRKRDPEGNPSDGEPPEEKTSEEMAQPAHEEPSLQAGATETARNRQETGAPKENASRGPTAGAGEAQDLKKALAEERARRKEAEEAAARAQEEKEEWKELAQAREEDLRQGIQGLADVVNQLKGELTGNQKAITDLQDELTELRGSLYERIQDEADTRQEAIEDLYDRIAGATEKRREELKTLWNELEEIVQRKEEKRQEAIETIETRLESRFGDLEERVEDLEGGILEGLTEQLGQVGQGLQKAAKENPEQAAEAANLLINFAVAYFAPQVIAGGKDPAQTGLQQNGLQQNDTQREQSVPNLGYGEQLVKQGREEGGSSSEETSPEDSSESSADGEAS